MDEAMKIAGKFKDDDTLLPKTLDCWLFKNISFEGYAILKFRYIWCI